MNEHVRIDGLPPRRGPGRPPGSPNRPKEPPLSLFEREELMQRLSVEYADAIIAHALAQERIRGIKSLALIKLGAAGFHEIESKLEMGNAQEADAADTGQGAVRVPISMVQRDW